jgi:hypothetical protein
VTGLHETVMAPLGAVTVTASFQFWSFRYCLASFANRNNIGYADGSMTTGQAQVNDLEVLAVLNLPTTCTDVAFLAALADSCQISPARFPANGWGVAAGVVAAVAAVEGLSVPPVVSTLARA